MGDRPQLRSLTSLAVTAAVVVVRVRDRPDRTSLLALFLVIDRFVREKAVASAAVAFVVAPTSDTKEGGLGVV